MNLIPIEQSINQVEETDDYLFNFARELVNDYTFINKRYLIFERMVNDIYQLLQTVIFKDGKVNIDLLTNKCLEILLGVNLDLNELKQIEQVNLYGWEISALILEVVDHYQLEYVDEEEDLDENEELDKNDNLDEEEGFDEELDENDNLDEEEGFDGDIEELNNP